MCIRDRNTSTYSPPEDGSRQPTRFSEASRRELAETENLLRVETQHAAPDEAGVCALFRLHIVRTPCVQCLENHAYFGHTQLVFQETWGWRPFPAPRCLRVASYLRDECKYQRAVRPSLRVQVGVHASAIICEMSATQAAPDLGPLSMQLSLCTGSYLQGSLRSPSHTN